MSIILVGLNYRTAPVELREKLALTGCALQMALDELQSYQPAIQNGKSAGNVREGVILSTCNRLEVYGLTDNHEAGWRFVDSFLANLQNIPFEEIKPHLYHAEGIDAVQHLMRVTAGLDSMILGEPQILGQINHAFSEAQSSGASGPMLSHLFSQSIHAGKRARTETDISRFTTSVSHAGALMILDKVTIQSPNILVVGAGEMAVLAAKSLQHHNITNLTFINRTYSRAEALASEIGGESLSWHQLDEALVWADAVITATGAPHTVIYTKDVERQLKNRQGRPLLFVDIALPRDIEDGVGELDGVQLYDIDDLQSIVDTNTAQRRAAIPQVESIIEEEMSTFFEWYHSREVTPVIKDLRRWAAELAQSEVKQALNKLGDIDPQTSQIVNRLAHRLVNKLLHEPTVRLRSQAAEGNGYGYAHAVSELFGLHNAECDMRRVTCDNKNDDLSDMGCNLQCITPNGKRSHDH